ncbi:lipase class 2 [Patulibacter medicamentivorans]|uniref:Lipase class 2 n=1 Tax=Patulibacter medicamentivorans TaxID=1097667 RepID=H0E9T4_9ACTN|nr:hypothetical protein [Patulibacter medicamentivorans]EHN09558.1 lipase class 2 [Patulibacter medicamentivorans]
MRRRTRTSVLALAVALTAAITPGIAAADPAPTVPQATLDAGLRCSADLDGATRTPVLLVPGTGADPKQNFDWTWRRSLAGAGIPACTIEVPRHSMGDIQVAAEYVANAIRRMHGRAGRPIAIVGHSQGGMSPRLALKYWPDTRAMVSDLIGIAPSNHGTAAVLLLKPLCSVLGCPAALWQQSSDSRLLQALNRGGETFPGIDYTVITTDLDEIVLPSTAGNLAAGPNVRNVRVQSICPGRLVEHLGIGLYDNVAHDLALDAITHPGPADPSRLGPGVCGRTFMPGTSQSDFVGNLLLTAAVPFLLNLVQQTTAADRLTREPPLKPWATAG